MFFLNHQKEPAAYRRDWLPLLSQKFGSNKSGYATPQTGRVKAVEGIQADTFYCFYTPGLRGGAATFTTAVLAPKLLG